MAIRTKTERNCKAKRVSSSPKVKEAVEGHGRQYLEEVQKHIIEEKDVLYAIVNECLRRRVDSFKLLTNIPFSLCPFIANP